MSDIQIHIIDIESGTIISRRSASSVPRVGDEVRLPGDKYFKVTIVVWCYDEPMERANIGVVKVGDK